MRSARLRLSIRSATAFSRRSTRRPCRPIGDFSAAAISAARTSICKASAGSRSDGKNAGRGETLRVPGAFCRGPGRSAVTSARGGGFFRFSGFPIFSCAGRFSALTAKAQWKGALLVGCTRVSRSCACVFGDSRSARIGQAAAFLCRTAFGRDGVPGGRPSGAGQTKPACPIRKPRRDHRSIPARLFVR